jgi:hypothetical protein
MEHNSVFRIAHGNPVFIQNLCQLPNYRNSLSAGPCLQSIDEVLPDRPADIERVTLVVRPFKCAQFPVAKPRKGSCRKLGRGVFERSEVVVLENDSHRELPEVISVQFDFLDTPSELANLRLFRIIEEREARRGITQADLA